MLHIRIKCPGVLLTTSKPSQYEHLSKRDDVNNLPTSWYLVMFSSYGNHGRQCLLYFALCKYNTAVMLIC